MSDTRQNSNVQQLVRLQVYVEKEEFEAIDDYRFSRRLPSRNAAVRALLLRGISEDDAGR